MSSSWSSTNTGTARPSRAVTSQPTSTLREWLEADLATNSKPFTLVFGHEPAFPKFRHAGEQPR